MPEEIKEEPVEEYDGSYVCFICSKSVRGRDALQCTQCQSNPFHRTCVAKYPSLAESCATCGGKTIEDWSLKSTSSAAPIDMIDLRSGSEGLGRRKDEENAKECEEDRLLKKQRRLLKNRESAQLSRHVISEDEAMGMGQGEKEWSVDPEEDNGRDTSGDTPGDTSGDTFKSGCGR